MRCRSAVEDAAEFDEAVSGSTPRAVRVVGTVTGTFVIGSNVTIFGAPGATIVGSLNFNGSTNVILRNLTIVGYNCTDAACGNGADAIAVRTEAHHLWFDHLDISDGTDGNLDITKGSDYVTVSWTKFHYSENRPGNTDDDKHRFSNLIGADANDTGDAGHLRVTFHHNWWADRVYARMPRVRYGKVHGFDNLYTATGNSFCIGVGYNADVRVENNVFIGNKDHDPARERNHRSSDRARER